MISFLLRPLVSMATTPIKSNRQQEMWSSEHQLLKCKFKRQEAQREKLRLVFCLKVNSIGNTFSSRLSFEKKKCRIIVEWHTLSSHTTVKGFGFFNRRIFFNPTPSISTQTISGAIFLSSGIASGFFAPFHRPGSSIMETLVGSVVPGTSSIIRKTSCLLLFAGASL